MQKLNSGALNRILLFVYILSLSTNAIAQNKNNSKETYLLPPHGNYVYGRVIEKLSKEPMVGVTIRLDGHSTGVITDKRLLCIDPARKRRSGYLFLHRFRNP